MLHRWFPTFFWTEPTAMARAPDEEGAPSASDAAPRRTRRLWVDDEQWFVHEVAVPRFDRRGGTHLLFESASVMRRVRVFPPDWYDMSDDALFALSLDIRSNEET